MDIIDLELESLKDGLVFSGRFYKKPIVIFNSASQCGLQNSLQTFKLCMSLEIVPIALPTNEFGASGTWG
jgi:glutathione peroxidase-family protein